MPVVEGVKGLQTDFKYNQELFTNKQILKISA